jgi:rsbT co-antagonist protein RsbR
MAEHKNRLAAIFREQESQLLSDWSTELNKTIPVGTQSRVERQEHARTFVRLLTDALHKGAPEDLGDPAWTPICELLTVISASRARQGSTPSETATFILSLKQPLFTRLRAEYKADAEGLAQEIWRATSLLDKLGLFTTEAFQRTREEVISRQQAELLELSTPVVSLWEGILAVPLIGTLDSERTQVVMENLLERIVQSGAAIAIIDITGVPTVDTLVAQHLMKTVGAARLMGAECIISGIRPQIAQTIIHLGVDLGNVVTKASLAAAFQVALDRIGASIVRQSSRD